MISRFLIIAVFNSSTGELFSSASLSCIDCFCISDSIVSRNSGSETLNCSGTCCNALCKSVLWIDGIASFSSFDKISSSKAYSRL